MKKILCLCLVLALCFTLVACDQSNRTKIKITDDTMAPVFTTGDNVIYESVDPDTLKVGDIIAFWTIVDTQRVVMLHRITEIYATGDNLQFQTKGDNNSQPDASIVHQTDVLGKYVRKAIFGLF